MNMESREFMSPAARTEYILNEIARDTGVEYRSEGGSGKYEKDGRLIAVNVDANGDISYELSERSGAWGTSGPLSSPDDLHRLIEDYYGMTAETAVTEMGLDETKTAIDARDDVGESDVDVQERNFDVSGSGRAYTGLDEEEGPGKMAA